MAFITILGENQLAAKQGAGQTLNMANFVLANIAGLGAEPADRIEAMPEAGDIVATKAITTSGYVNTNQVVYSLVMDSDVGDFDFNWIGLVDDEGVLIAATYVPTISKTANNGVVQGNNLTRNFLLAYTGITATAAIAVSAETWQIDFNARLHGIDERERLSNFDIYGHAGFFGTGFSVVQQGSTSTYDILPGIAYVGGVRVDSLATQTATIATAGAIWLDVSLQGDISDVSAVALIIADGAAHNDYTDGLGFEHYVTKLADIAANGNVSDQRVSGEPLDDHLADADAHSQYLKKSDTVSQAAAEAGTATTVRAWTALRVKQAIDALVKAASETVAGLVKRATQAEVDAGADDSRYITPLKMRFGFSISLGSNGYIVFPTWMGGVILQWGYSSTGSPPMDVTFNLAFPNNVFIAHVTDVGIANESPFSVSGLNQSGFTINLAVGGGMYWFAIGH